MYALEPLRVENKVGYRYVKLTRASRVCVCVSPYPPAMQLDIYINVCSRRKGVLSSYSTRLGSRTNCWLVEEPRRTSTYVYTFNLISRQFPPGNFQFLLRRFAISSLQTSQI